MQDSWLPRPERALHALWLCCAVACSDPSSSKGGGSESNSVQGACVMPRVVGRTEKGSMQSALPEAMTLPVPASIAIRGGAANASATLSYSLPADGNRPLSCRYQRSGDALTLVNCDREVDATSWLEASALSLHLSDPNAEVALQLCPVGRVDDQALLRPSGDQPALRGERMAGAGARAVGFELIAGALTTEDVLSYADRARADARVQALLGERSAFVQEIDRDQTKAANRTSHQLRLIFYSHSHSRTVEVTMDHGTVLEAKYIEYYPPEGKQEIEQAVALAKQDARLAGLVADLQAGGMNFQHTQNSDYLNHRVMDIRFYDATLVSRYFAVVDLTELKVQAAGPVQ
jgi:hypothetical protein